MSLINIGFGNLINDNKITAIISPDSAPSKRLVSNAKEAGKVIDATQGRRTRAIIVTDNNQIILSALLPETISGRVNDFKSKGEYNE